MKRIDSAVRRDSSFTESSKHHKDAFNFGPWSIEEHRRFLEGFEAHGSLWSKVQQHVGTRSCSQVKAHCTRYLRRLRSTLRRELLRCSCAGLISGRGQTPRSAPLAAARCMYSEVISGSEPDEKEKGYEGIQTEDRLLEGIKEVLREETGRDGTAEEEAEKDALYTSWGDTLIPLENFCIQLYLKGRLSLAR